ncbi:MAG: hypothetical protein RR893_06930, partial [Clostridia bacterium]
IIYETIPKNAEYWVELLENGVQEFFYAPIQREQMVSYFPQYMAGEITIDRFISNMQDNIV